MKENSIEEAKKILEKFITEHKLFNIKHSDGLEESIETLLTAYETEKEKNKKAKEFIKENSHEFHCKRDELIELEFDDNTNATDLIDILDGNW